MPATKGPPIFRPDRRPPVAPKYSGALAPAITLTFNSTLSRVEIYATNLGNTATYAVIDRSLDGVRWTTVRGAAELALLVQDLPSIWYDYEFPLGTVTYRVRSYNALGGLVVPLSGSVAASLDSVWIKSPIRPFLNLEVSLGGRDFEMDRAGRGAAYGVQDRSLPVGVTQLPESKRYPLLVRTTSDAQDQQLDFLLASGDVLFLHAPTGKTVPGGGRYLMVEGDRDRLLRINGDRRHRTIPVREVAAPGPDVGYALLTWQTILDLYGTLDALLAANATLDDLLLLLAEPSEVIAE